MTEITTSANGEQVMTNWKKVSVGDGGETLVSTGVTKTVTTTYPNGKQEVTNWKNVNVDADGNVLESNGVTLMKIFCDENSQKKREPLGKYQCR